MAEILKRLGTIWDDLEPETQMVSGTIVCLTIAILILVGVLLMLFPHVSLLSAIGLGSSLEAIGLSALAMRVALTRK
jgi:hypothetical protein